MGLKSKQKAVFSAAPIPAEPGLELGAEVEDEAMSDADQDEAQSSEPEETTPVPPKAPGVFHAPTTQELVKLREGSDLFKSNTFKLQLDELLGDVSANDAQRNTVERVLMTLHEHLSNLPAVPACKPPSVVKKRTAVPYPAPLPSEESQWTVSFERPSNIQLVGSWANGVAVRGNEGGGFSVDLAVEMPAALFREKDYLNARYFHQRAYYLAVIASSLVSKGNTLGLGYDDVAYESPEYDARRTTLVIAPTKGSTSELARSKLKTPLSIRIIPTLPQNHPLSERHLAPGRASIRTAAADSVAEPTPTPLYNNLVQLGTSPLPHLLAAHNAKNQIPSYADTLALVKVWANQRGYGSGRNGGRTVRGCGGLGAWWGAVIVYLVLGGKNVKGVKKQQRVGRGLSSYQLFRAVLDFLAKHDFTTAPVFLGDSPYALEDWKEHHDAIFVDSTGRYNMLAGVPVESLELLRLDAQASLGLLDEATDEAFEAVFLHDLRHPALRFDYSLRVPLDNAKSRTESLGKTLEWSSRTNSLLSTLSSTVRKALGTRVKACAVVQPAPALRPISQSTPNSPPYIELGLVLDPVEAHRLVDYGPPADDPTGSEVFRAFWGSKSELRRFKDGRILESVVWDISHPDERVHIPGRIVRHILELHFGIKLEDVRRTVYDEVLRMPSSVVKIYSSVAENQMTFRPALTAFDALVKQIKASEGLPLALVTASPISPILRGTSAFYPWPIDFARYSKLPDSVKYIPPMEVVLQLEKSARWPDDLAAIQKIKLAFFVGIADALRAQDDKIRAAVALDSDASETDIHDNCSLEVLTPSGFAFRLRIYHDREKTLLDGIISDRKTAPGVVATAKDALRTHETRFVHAPRHHTAVAALTHRFPSYAPAVRLTLRWLGAHLLLPHISHSLVELIVAREFLKPGAPPASAPTAFARVVQTLRDWRWREEPLVVPIFSSLDEVGKDGKKLAKEAEEACKALRREDPTMSRGAWVVVTEEDTSGLRWSGCVGGGPRAIVAARAQQVAKASLEYILGQDIVEKTLFVHPLSDYDFVIHLDPKVLPRYGENIAVDPGFWTASRGYVNDRGNDIEPLVGLDPATEYFADLQRAFGNVALFFHDPHGGALIAGLWDPKPTTQVTAFKVMLGYSSMPAEGKVVFNKNAVLNEMKMMGEGMHGSNAEETRVLPHSLPQSLYMESRQTAKDKPCFRHRLQEIKLDPDRSTYEVNVGLLVDGVQVHRLPLMKKRHLLRWSDLCLPCDIHEDSTLAVQVTEVRALHDRIGKAVYQYSEVKNQDTVSIRCDNGVFTVTMRFMDNETSERAYSEACAKVQLMERQPNPRQKAGRVRDSFKALLTFGSMMTELDPTEGAKIAFSVCTMAWEHLEAQEKQDADLSDLIVRLAGMIPSIESVRNVAGTDLEQTITAMLNLIEDVSLFVSNSQSLSSFGRALRAFNPPAREQTEAFISKFRMLREEFDTRVNVYAFLAAETERVQAKLKDLKPVDLASYDPTRQCIAGTRVGIIGEIIAWARDPNASPRLAWVHGLAGLGKSSIATSVCQQLDDWHILASSFFCRRDDPKLRDPRRVLTTIIYSLALRWEPYGKAVVTAIREDPELHSRHIHPLYDALVTKPLHSLGEVKHPANPLVVVVDALDECGDTVTRKQLLSCLHGMSRLTPLLKIIVTSRPGLDIQEYFAHHGIEGFMEYNVLRHDALADIHVFVQARLGSAVQADSWPKDAVEKLSVRSSGLFIWAQTACKFILDGYDRPKRMEQILAGTHLSDSSADLDVLYATAVKAGAVDDSNDNMNYVLKCLGAIVVMSTRKPLSASGLAMLLCGRIPLDVLNRVLGNLSPVLYVDQKHDAAVRISHPSFMDFITDPSRSGDLCVDLNQQNAIFAECCLELMDRNLKFNICGLETSHVFDCDVPGLDMRVRDKLGSHLSYACLYWSSHIAQTRVSGVDARLQKFLFGHKLLYWLEALALLKKLSVALSSLLELMACNIIDNMPGSRTLVNDAYRFVLAFYDPISRSTPHLYVSALAFTPAKSEISQRLRTFFPKLLLVTQGTNNEWSPCLRTMWTSDYVRSSAFSPNGRLIVSGSGDSTVRIWDAETGDAALEPLRGHSDGVQSVAFSPDGHLIVSGSNDTTVRIWNVETGEAMLEPLRGHSDFVQSVIFSPDGHRVASGSYDRTIRIWRVETGGMVLEPLQGHSNWVISIVFSPNGRRIVSGSADHTVRIWDADAGREVIQPLRGHSDWVRSVAFSPNGRHVISGSDDKTIRVWDAETGDAVLKPLQGHAAGVASLAFSPDGYRIASGSADRTVRIWDTETGKAVYDPLEGHSNWVLSVGFSPDGHRVVSGSNDKSIRIWDTVEAENPEKSFSTCQGHSGQVHSVAFSLDGRYVVSGSEDKTVRVWDATTGSAVLEPLQGHTDRVTSVAFSPNGRHVVSGSFDKTLRIWDTKTGDVPLGPLRGHSDQVWSVAFSSDGLRIISGSSDCTVRIWDAESGHAAVKPLQGHSHVVRAVAFSPNGRWIVSGSDDYTVRIWNAETGDTVLGPLQGHFDLLWSVAFSPDSSRVVSASADETLRIWDIETGEAMLKPLKSTSFQMRSVAFSPDGRYLASGSEDWTMRLWDTKTGNEAFGPFEGHKDWVVSVAFSPDGRWVTSGSKDGTLRFWDMWEYISPNFQVPRFLAGTRLRVFPAHLMSPKIAPTGAQLASHTDSPGWVAMANGELLFWVPPDLRGVDHSSLCIYSSRVGGQAIIDLSKFVHGNSWASITEI